MRLDYLCDMDLAYGRGTLYNGVWASVSPYGTQESALYGEGDGSVRGERLSGTMRWVNHARRRGDGVNLPDLHGIIKTEDGALVFVSLAGRTQPVQADGKRRQLLTVVFEAEEERYRWLNTAVCVLEGLITSASGTMHARVFVCVHELE